jgi:GDP-mannose 6-dehydrogenase
LRIVLFGLGRVGATMAACLAAAGREILGIDPDPAVVAAVARGRAPVREPGLDGLLRRGVTEGRITAATAPGDRLDEAGCVLVCVATPADPGTGKLDLSALRDVSRQLGAAIRDRRAGAPPLLIVYRSTVPPGTVEGVLLPLLAETAGEGPGPRYEVAFNPEFLRQGSAVADFQRPARIVVGERRLGASRRLGGLYDHLTAPLLEVPLAVAELAKLVDNSWHALKVAFANEVGRASVASGLDPRAVMAVLLADPERSLGAAYLRPGGPYGGACLPKDLAALLAHAGGAGALLPVLGAVANSNALHLGWLVERVRALLPPPGPVLQLGLSFKAGTEDLHGSPLLELARALVGAGYELLLHDPDLAPERLRAAAAALGAVVRPSLAAALRPAAGVRLLLVGKPAPGLDALLPEGVPVLDMVGSLGSRAHGADGTRSRGTATS